MNKTPSAARGYALLAALLLLLLLSGMAVGLVYLTNTEARLGGTDRENTVAYYGAEAAMEQMISDLSALYGSMQVPTQADIDALEATKPGLPGIEFSHYDLGNVGPTKARTLTAGPQAGLIGLITPITLSVVARRPGGVEVKMSREVEIAQIPIFQFAKFSEFDLSISPGPAMVVAGRVHTNGNLFVSNLRGGLRFQTRVTAVKEVVRDMSLAGAPVPAGPVYFSTALTGCPNTTTNCRELKTGEGSVIGWWTGPPNPSWPTISTGSPPSGFNGNLLNGTTGVRRLELPFMASGSGLRAIEIIRRPRTGESASSPEGQSRLYNQAQIRVLLSDNPADLPGGAADAENVRLANLPGTAYPGGITIGGKTYYFATGKDGGAPPPDKDWLKPLTDVAGSTIPAGGTWPLLDGWLRVEIRKTDGTWMGVTKEWLQLGFARDLNSPNSEIGQPNSIHPNAILIFQQQNDTNGNGTLQPGEGTPTYGSGSEHSWVPINLYDTREGDVEIGDGTFPPSLNTCALLGIMNVVEVDVGNLRRWLFGTIGATGTQVEETSQNGFVLYFSDRRGLIKNPNLSPPAIIGEFGFEDVVDPPNGLLDPGEDSNGNGILDLWGKENLGDGFVASAQGGDTPDDHPFNTRVSCRGQGNGGPDKGAASKNRVSGARHGLKLVNGSLGNLPTKRGGGGGFTVASENSIYVLGNYNATTNSHLGWTTEPHSAAALIGDRITLLSRSWKDSSSFRYPTDVLSRVAVESWYRMAALVGGQLGSGGGVGLLEEWTNRTWHYRTSEVSLYQSEYGTGLGGCCPPTYRPPVRDLSFDTDFLVLETMPPATPMLRDVVNLGFRQVFRAD